MQLQGAENVVQALEQVCNRIGYPRTIRVDQSSAFDGRFRTECMNAHWFLSLDDARAKMEEWRKDYNEVRPHSAIGKKPPISLLSAPGPYGHP